MHSSRLPSMLSRRHAAIRLDPVWKLWLVEDLGVGDGERESMCGCVGGEREMYECAVCIQNSYTTAVCTLS